MVYTRAIIPEKQEVDMEEAPQEGKAEKETKASKKSQKKK